MRQDLPHLTSAIQALTVSPSGTSYAIQLADNSVMVLSTTELLPKANFPGLQSQFIPKEPSLFPQIKTLSSINQESDDPLDVIGKAPAVGNPRNPNQLLLAVSGSQDANESINTPPLASYLQTYDVFTARHVSRQALARNNITGRTMGPERNKLDEPNITHLQISANGQWLASIDEWAPPAQDIDFAVIDADKVAEERLRRLEIHLKFWSWDDEGDQWVLETRIDSPHQSSTNASSKRVLDLIAHPSSNTFATIGQDGVVRVWKPKKKTRDGAVTSIAWTAVLSIELEREPVKVDPGHDFPSPPAPTNAKLAYSNDGSVLTAAQESPEALEAGLVHFLNADTGVVSSSEIGLYTTGLIGIGFLDRNFIVMSIHDIRVWDVVANKLVFGHKLKLPKLTIAQKCRMSHVAFNVTSGTFAIAVPTVDKEVFGSNMQKFEPELSELYSTISVFEPVKANAVWYNDVPLVTTLVGMRGASGFFVLDSSAEVTTIAPKSAIVFIAAPPIAAHREPEESLVLQKIEEDGEEDVDMEDEDMEDEDGEAEDGEQDDEDMPLEDDGAVVRPEQLAGVLDRGPSFGLPSVKDLFDGVIGLYGRKDVSIQ
jgi:NET1-associated nuclear protein 1 (U3 small nucleolar RNA-associated protein 17)